MKTKAGRTVQTGARMSYDKYRMLLALASLRGLSTGGLIECMLDRELQSIQGAGAGDRMIPRQAEEVQHAART
jgi:hypothetical protein